jgi:hypothetical protein
VGSQLTRVRPVNFPGSWKKARKKPGQTKEKGEPTPIQENPDEMLMDRSPETEPDNLETELPQAAGGEEAIDDPIHIETESFLDDLQGLPATFTRATLETGAGLLDRLEIQVSDLKGKADPFMVQQSKIALALLQGARKLKIKGNTLFGTYIKCMSKSKFYNLALIGKHPEVHPYAYLGIERLKTLLNLEKKMGIGFEDLLRNYGLIFNPEGEEPLSAFKVRVDKDIAAAKASRREANPDQQSVKKFHSGAKKVEKAITSILESPGLAEQVDREKVSSLKDKLAELELLIRPN